MFKKAKVVMLPTNQKAIKGDLLKRHIWKGTKNECNSLWKFNEEIVIDNVKQYTTLNNSFRDMISVFEPQHLYITSDEEIKEGDWFIANQAPRQCIRVETKNTSCPYITLQDVEEVGHFHTWHNIIIASTDSNINLPQPSQAFITKYIEEYNKGNIITDVLVEYENIFDSKITIIDENSIIPDNHFKLKVNPKDNTITIKKIKDNWNREEIIKLCKDSHYAGSIGIDRDIWLTENL